MMNITYMPHRSNIMEYLLVPKELLTMEMVDELSPKEQALFAEYVPILRQVVEQLQPLKTRIEKDYLWNAGFSFLHVVYFQLLHRGRDPKTIEAFCQEARMLSDLDLEEVIRISLAESGEGKKKDELWQLLEEASLKAEDKWYWSQAIRQPKQALERALSVLELVVPIYEPFLEQGQAVRDRYASDFSLMDFIGDHPDFSFPTEVKGVQIEEIQLCVFSPWVIRFSYYYSSSYAENGLLACFSVGVEQLLVHKAELDVEDVVLVFKNMSDATRYQVMVEMVRPHVKSKEVAERLGITGAAVSFHTQKLANSQLLLHNSKDKEIKFDANKELLRQVIERLRADFEL